MSDVCVLPARFVRRRHEHLCQKLGRRRAVPCVQHAVPGRLGVGDDSSPADPALAARRRRPVHRPLGLSEAFHDMDKGFYKPITRGSAASAAALPSRPSKFTRSAAFRRRSFRACETSHGSTAASASPNRPGSRRRSMATTLSRSSNYRPGRRTCTRWRSSSPEETRGNYSSRPYTFTTASWKPTPILTTRSSGSRRRDGSAGRSLYSTDSFPIVPRRRPGGSWTSAGRGAFWTPRR